MFKKNVKKFAHSKKKLAKINLLSFYTKMSTCRLELVR